MWRSTRETNVTRQMSRSRRRTNDSTEVAATDFRNGYFTCRDIGESRRSANQSFQTTCLMLWCHSVSVAVDFVAAMTSDEIRGWEPLSIVLGNISCDVANERWFSTRDSYVTITSGLVCGRNRLNHFDECVMTDDGLPQRF